MIHKSALLKKIPVFKFGCMVSRKKPLLEEQQASFSQAMEAFYPLMYERKTHPVLSYTAC